MESMQLKIEAGAAVFVKTIGLSPLKTRLAKTVGEGLAHEFYKRSCATIQSVLLSSNSIVPYWAIAEGEGGYEYWSSKMGKMEQGGGCLGMRLNFVYEVLLGQYGKAILMGADAPQISPSLIHNAIDLSNDGSFVVGPARDGGFYLLLGSKPIDLDLWLGVPYSASNTLDSLVGKLEKIAPVKYLEPLGDVDVIDDIPNLSKDLSKLESPLDLQRSLNTWLEKLTLLEK